MSRAIVPQSKRNGLSKAAGELFAVGKQGMEMGMIKEAHKMFKELTATRQRIKSAKPVKQTVEQRSKVSAAPTAFGISSNDVVRVVLKNTTPTMARMSGVSYLGPVQSPSVLSTLPTVSTFSSSNPITFKDRLQVLASTYDKYVFNSVRLKYVPAVGTSTAGKVGIAIDRDYTDPPQTGSWGETISYEAVASGTVWSQHSCSIKRDSNEKRTYFTNLASGVEIRETEQFKFYAYTQGVPINTFCGDLYLEYDIDLISPVYAPHELSSVLPIAGTFISSGTASYLTALSSSCTITGLPVGDGTRMIYEVMFNGIAPGSTALTIGAGLGAPNYFPQIVGTYRYFVRALRNSPLNQLFSVYLDLPAALNDGTVLYNGTAAAVVLSNANSFAYRQVTFPARD